MPSRRLQCHICPAASYQTINGFAVHMHTRRESDAAQRADGIFEHQNGQALPDTFKHGRTVKKYKCTNCYAVSYAHQQDLNRHQQLEHGLPSQFDGASGGVEATTERSARSLKQDERYDDCVIDCEPLSKRRNIGSSRQKRQITVLEPRVCRRSRDASAPRKHGSLCASPTRRTSATPTSVQPIPEAWMILYTERSDAASEEARRTDQLYRYYEREAEKAQERLHSAEDGLEEYRKLQRRNTDTSRGASALMSHLVKREELAQIEVRKAKDCLEEHLKIRDDALAASCHASDQLQQYHLQQYHSLGPRTQYAP